MADGQDQGIVAPASSDAIGAFLKLDEGGRKDLLRKLSPNAKQALLFGLRTMSQAKAAGQKPLDIPAPGTKSTRMVPGRFGMIPEEVEEGGPGENLPSALLKRHGGELKWAGAAGLTLAAPEAGLPAAIGLAGLGGGAGEATNQLLQQGITPSEAPQSSEEAARGIGSASLQTASAELGGRILSKSLGYGLRAYIRHTDPFNYGVQSLFRGLNPSSNMPELRGNIVEAADDLVNVYNKVDKDLASPEVKGGVLNEDLRLRKTHDALNDYMKEMYQSERKAQIDLGTQNNLRVTVQGDADKLQMVGRWLSRPRGLPLNSPQLRAAQSLARNPLQPIPIAEADALAKAVNELDLKSARERSLSGLLDATSELDKGLKLGINEELKVINLPGISSYERRYAALAQIRDLLESGMTGAEKRTFNQRLHSFVSLHGINLRSHLGMFESPGGLVEEGLSSLREAGRGGRPSPLSPIGVPQGEFVDVPPKAGQLALGRPKATKVQNLQISTKAPKELPPAPPKMIAGDEIKLLPPPKAEGGVNERRVAPGVSPTGEERRGVAEEDEEEEVPKKSKPSRRRGGLKPPPKRTDVDF